MRCILSLLLFINFSFANQFDMFDEIDKETNIKDEFEVEDRFIDIQSRLNYQYNDNSSDDKKFYLNLSKNETNYYFDIRFLADEESYSINLKELYYKGAISEKNIFEIGRINIADGFARGYNPTDYFKGGSSFINSKDPKEIKDNRLGSIMFKNTIFLDSFTVKAIYSPKISVDKDSTLSSKKHYGLNLDKTNYHDRYTLALDYNGFKDISSLVVLHKNEDDLNFGFNLSYIDNNWIFYTENSYKNSKDDFSKVVKKLNLHPTIQNHFKKDKENIYQNVIGFKHTSDNNIVTTLEYIHNSMGLNKKGWNDWFSLSSQNKSLETQLKAISGTINKNENIMSKESIFLHLYNMDMFVNTDGSLLIKLNPYDKSFLSQIGLEYSYNDNIQINSYLKNYSGKTKSEYGSLDNNSELLLELKYFF